MDIKKISSCLIASVLLFVSTPGLSGPDGLLGLQETFPSFDFRTPSFSADPGAEYDVASETLTINAEPTFLTFTGSGDAEEVFGGTLTIILPIDTTGAFKLTGPNSFTVTGSVTDQDTGTNYSGTLISGTVSDYGLLNIGATDLADIALVVTGGSLMSLFTAANGDTSAAAIFALKDSTYTGAGSFMTGWGAANSKGDLGAAPSVPELPPSTIGYWKNHPEVWNIVSLSICGDTLDQNALLSILSTPTRGDKTIVMTQQWIAASLNELAGNGSCSTAISDAEGWICSHGGIGSSRRKWDGGEPIKDTLDNFNNGLGCI